MLGLPLCAAVQEPVLTGVLTSVLHMGYWDDPATINEIVRRIAQQRGRQK